MRLPETTPFPRVMTRVIRITFAFHVRNELLEGKAHSFRLWSSDRKLIAIDSRQGSGDCCG